MKCGYCGGNHPPDPTAGISGCPSVAEADKKERSDAAKRGWVTRRKKN
jgi:hypothetical protein